MVWKELKMKYFEGEKNEVQHNIFDGIKEKHILYGHVSNDGRTGVYERACVYFC